MNHSDARYPDEIAADIEREKSTSLQPTGSAVDWSVDVTRGPDVVVPSTVAGGKFKLGRCKMQWSKLRRVFEDAILAAERGNYLTMTVQFQPVKTTTPKPEEEA